MVKLMAVMGLVVVLGAGACGGDSTMVMSADELGEGWPLTVDEVRVRCEPAFAVVARAEGIDYAVNGAAMGQAEEWAWVDIAVLTLPDPELGAMGVSMSVAPIIDVGLGLCDAS